MNAEGLLLGDRPHSVKAQLVAELPFGFLVGANYLYQSGRAWSSFVRIPGLGFPAAPLVQAEARDGRRRLPSQSLLDLRVQKSARLGRKLRAAVFGDILNVLNEDAHEAVLSQVGDAPQFGIATSFMVPRVLMLGTKLTF